MTFLKRPKEVLFDVQNVLTLLFAQLEKRVDLSWHHRTASVSRTMLVDIQASKHIFLTMSRWVRLMAMQFSDRGVVSSRRQFRSESSVLGGF
jgi:hypothetical protein